MAAPSLVSQRLWRTCQSAFETCAMLIMKIMGWLTSSAVLSCTIVLVASVPRLLTRLCYHLGCFNESMHVQKHVPVLSVSES